MMAEVNRPVRQRVEPVHFVDIARPPGGRLDVAADQADREADDRAALERRIAKLERLLRQHAEQLEKIKRINHNARKAVELEAKAKAKANKTPPESAKSEPTEPGPARNAKKVPSDKGGPKPANASSKPKPKARKTADYELPPGDEAGNAAMLIGLQNAARSDERRATFLRNQAKALAAVLPLPIEIPPDRPYNFLLFLAWIDDTRTASVIERLEPGTLSDKEISTLVRSETVRDDPATILRLAKLSAAAEQQVRLLLQASRLHYRNWDLHKAFAIADEVLGMVPENPDALSIQAEAASHFGDDVLAVDKARAALAANPFARRALIVLSVLGDPDYRRLSAPEYIMARFEETEPTVTKAIDVANILTDNYQFDQAFAVMEKALEVWRTDPDRSDRVLSSIVQNMANNSLARQDFRGVVTLAGSLLSRQTGAVSNAALALAHGLVECGSYGQAIGVLSLDDQPVEMFKVPAFQSLMAGGRIGEAFGLYRKRPHFQGLATAYPDRCPTAFVLAEGHELGRSAFFFPEGGPGDEIRLASQYGELAGMFEKVAIACEPRLLSLMARSFPHVEFRPVLRFRQEYRAGDYAKRDRVRDVSLALCLNNDAIDLIEQNDFSTSLLNTLADLRPDKDHFPRLGQYLVPAPEAVARWAGRLNTGGARHVRRIAICWRSMLLSPWRMPHYLDVADLAPLASIPDAEFWVIQTHVTEDEMQRLRAILPNVRVPEGLDTKDDFEELSAFLCNMDHVIAPFVTNGELAGALGVPTTLLCTSHLTAWRQRPDGTDVWHSSARLVRGAEIDDRSGAVMAAAESIIAALGAPGRRESVAV